MEIEEINLPSKFNKIENLNTSINNYNISYINNKEVNKYISDDEDYLNSRFSKHKNKKQDINEIIIFNEQSIKANKQEKQELISKLKEKNKLGSNNYKKIFKTYLEDYSDSSSEEECNNPDSNANANNYMKKIIQDTQKNHFLYCGYLDNNDENEEITKINNDLNKKSKIMFSNNENKDRQNFIIDIDSIVRANVNCCGCFNTIAYNYIHKKNLVTRNINNKEAANDKELILITNKVENVVIDNVNKFIFCNECQIKVGYYNDLTGIYYLENCLN